MMTVCPILPKKYTKNIWKIKDEGFGAMVLRQHIRTKDAYRVELNEEQKKKKIYMILDNGAAEGKYTDVEKIIKTALATSCKHFVMPDVYWTNENAAEETMKLILENKQRVEDLGVIDNAMCVLNSFNAQANLENMIKLLQLGFSVFAIPMIPNRPVVIESIRSKLDYLKSLGLKYIHALGMLSPIEISMYDGVCNSIDTSMFAKYQLYSPSKVVPHFVKNEPYTKYETRDEKFFNKEMTDSDFNNIVQTINSFRKK